MLDRFIFSLPWNSWFVFCLVCPPGLACPLFLFFFAMAAEFLGSAAWCQAARADLPCWRWDSCLSKTCVRYLEPAPVGRGLFTVKLGGKGAVWRIDLRVYVAVMAFRNFIFKPDAVYRKARETLARQSTEPLRLQVYCPIFRDFGFWQLKDFLLTIDSLHCSC